MRPPRKHTIGRLVAVLNRDILREFHMAETCLRQAAGLSKKYHPVVYRQIGRCAAAALTNATALAAEVLVLGGVPVNPGQHAKTAPQGSCNPAYGPQARARAMLTHYRRRLRMAERMGLLRLREVFQQIVATKEWHLAHSGPMRAGDPSGRYLYS